MNFKLLIYNDIFHQKEFWLLRGQESIYEKGGLGFSRNQLHTKVTQKANKHTTAPDIRESIGELR